MCREEEEGREQRVWQGQGDPNSCHRSAGFSNDGLHQSMTFYAIGSSVTTKADLENSHFIKSWTL